MFKLNNLEQFLAQIDKWEAETKQEVEAVARGYAATAFDMLLEWSPQFSGDFTANWKYQINGITPSFTPGLVTGGSTVGEYGLAGSKFTGGSPEAIAVAKALNTGKDAAFKLGDTIFMHNSAAHDEPYALLIETNQIKFRPGNSGATVARTVVAMSPFANINKATAATLMSRRV